MPAPSRQRLLWLLRHAKTVADPPPGGTDHDRVLARRGRRDAEALARRLGEGGDGLGLAATDRPEIVLCSSARRTIQTAELALSAMALPPPVLPVRFLYGATPEGVIEEVRLLDDDVASAMVVGHNPTTHNLAVDLLASDDAEGRGGLTARGFPTCALAVYRLASGRWADLGDGRGALVGFFTPPY